MKASNFSDAQKAFIIKQGEDGTPVSVASIRFEWRIHMFRRARATAA